jgi:prepilin-type N-terminal cleavage/methylation domain-containing protein
MRRMLSAHRTPRRGFTLVELLVVIAIIGMLVALLIPAVGAARARMRKASCLNNMRQIGTALIAYDSDKQRLPGYIEAVKARSRSAPKTNGFVIWQPGPTTPYVDSVFGNSDDTSDNSRKLSRIAWSAQILPNVDRGDIWELVQGAVGTSGDTALLNQQTVPKIQLYVCADDTDLTSTEDAAGISYSVNSGTWDWNGTNYVGDTKENGLFQNMVDGNLKARISDAKDGSATTIMLSENMNKNDRYSWMGVDNTPGEQQLGITWVISPNPASDCSGRASQFPFNDDGANAGVTPGQWDAGQPCFARPNTLHVGDSFNTVFADGHGTSIDVNIDYTVYQQLLTTHGAKCSDPAVPSNSQPQAIIDFRNAPPLAESDFD